MGQYMTHIDNTGNLEIKTSFSKPLHSFGRAFSLCRKKKVRELPSKAVDTMIPETIHEGGSHLDDGLWTHHMFLNDGPRQEKLLPERYEAPTHRNRFRSMSSDDTLDISPFAGGSLRMIIRNKAQCGPPGGKSGRQVRFSEVIEVFEVPSAKKRWPQPLRRKSRAIIQMEEKELSFIPDAALIPAMKVWIIDDSLTFQQGLETSPMLEFT